MRIVSLLGSAVLCVLCSTRAWSAPVVIDFENLGDLDAVGSQYAGLTFSNAIALTAGVSLNEFDFPPHSGLVAVSDDGGPIGIQFAAPVTSIAGFFTYAAPIAITAYDSNGNVVASAMSSFASNLGLDPGSSPNEFIQLLASVAIWSVVIAGDAGGGSFVLDDLTLSPQELTEVPEPGTLALLLVGSAAIVSRYKRRRARTRGVDI